MSESELPTMLVMLEMMVQMISRIKLGLQAQVLLRSRKQQWTRRKFQRNMSQSRPKLLVI